MSIKKLFITATACLFFLATLHPLNASDDQDLLKKATFTIDTDGATLKFVLLNNKTVDMLFTGSSKYAIRARANASTVFYVLGKADKNFDFNPEFEVVQNEQSIGATPINIKNFVDGPLAKGTRIEGLLELSQKLNMHWPFRLKDTRKEYAEFQYDWNALEESQN